MMMARNETYDYDHSLPAPFPAPSPATLRAPSPATLPAPLLAYEPRVRFSEARDVIPITDLSKGPYKQNLWFTRHELDAFMVNTAENVKMVRLHMSWGHVPAASSILGLEKSLAVGPDDDYSVRKRKLYMEVLQEARRQRASRGVPRDPERLTRVSARNSKWARERARVAALSLEQDQETEPERRGELQQAIGALPEERQHYDTMLSSREGLHVQASKMCSDPTTVNDQDDSVMDKEGPDDDRLGRGGRTGRLASEKALNGILIVAGATIVLDLLTSGALAIKKVLKEILITVGAAVVLYHLANHQYNDKACQEGQNLDLTNGVDQHDRVEANGFREGRDFILTSKGGKHGGSHRNWII